MREARKANSETGHPSFNREVPDDKGGGCMTPTSKKCAHVSCNCQVTEEKYCSQLCKDAGAEETEISCDCGHPACEVAVAGD